jgi:hypothetical protein
VSTDCQTQVQNVDCKTKCDRSDYIFVDLDLASVIELLFPLVVRNAYQRLNTMSCKQNTNNYFKSEFANALTMSLEVAL